MHINDSSLTNARVCHGVGVGGIHRNAPPLPVAYIARHKIVGTVFIGDFRNLVSVSKLFDTGHSLEGDHNHLHVRSKEGKVVLTGVRDHQNMLMANLSNPTSY